MSSTPTGITIGIKEIKFLHFESTTRTQEIKAQLPNDAYEFQFEMQSSIEEKDKLLTILLAVTLYEKQSNETKVELAKMKMQIAFIVVNFEEVTKKENELFSVPDQLVLDFDAARFEVPPLHELIGLWPDRAQQKQRPTYREWPLNSHQQARRDLH